MNWTICQIGAREGYAVARALEARGALERLVTDLWVPEGHALGRLSGRLNDRFHPQIPRAKVRAPNAQALWREGRDRAVGRAGWDQIMARNAWFQRMAAAELGRLKGDEPRTVFAYSYAAAGIFEAAKARGWRTVLGQIDPGPVEARLVEALYREAGDTTHAPIPDAYWTAWRRETDLADRIVVNSEWSRQGLVEEGVDPAKLVVLPLAYEIPHMPPTRDPPKAFSHEHPLRLLFLGQITLRKGIDLVFEALQGQPDLPVTLDVVGPVQVTVPGWVHDDPRITLYGAVPRSAVGEFYAHADVFLFPTRSDGFGLTQLEALSAGVPVIASARCGDVVHDGVNGCVLQDLSAAALGQVLQGLAADPTRVAAWHRAARLEPHFALAALGDGLAALQDSLVRAA